MALAKEERHTMAVWLNELDYDEWDREMARDFSSSGRGTARAERVERESPKARKYPSLRDWQRPIGNVPASEVSPRNPPVVLEVVQFNDLPEDIRNRAQ